MQSKSKLVTIIIALLISVSLWFYVVTVENPEHTATISGIPVDFTGLDALNEDQGLIITSGLDTAVTLRLTGTRSEINKLDKDNIIITVDVSRITRAQDYTLNYDIEYPPDVKASAITVDSNYPSHISMTVERAATKKVDVRGELIGGPAEGYTTEEMSFDYSQIMIQGPEELVEQVEYALVTLERANFEKTITTFLPYVLFDKEGAPVESGEITCDVKEIEVTLPVVKFKQIPLNVEFIPGGGATENDVVIQQITPSTVTISGDPTVLDMVNQINLGNIDLSNLISEGTYEFNILLPNNVKNVSGEETATVEVEIRGLETKTVRLTTVEFAQVPEGFEAGTMTQTLQVTVRASSDDIGQITASNVHAIADMSGIGANVGTYTVPLVIEIYGYPDAGVIGTYNAVVTLREEVEVPIEPTEDDPDADEDPSVEEGG